MTKLDNLESSLVGYKQKLFEINTEMKSLQERSTEITVKLRNRKQFEEELFKLLDSIILAPEFLNEITDNEIDDCITELFCETEMFNKYDYTWLGHIHKPQVLSKKPYIGHIGSMDISDFGEKNQEKFIVLFDSNSFDAFEIILNIVSINIKFCVCF